MVLVVAGAAAGSLAAAAAYGIAARGSQLLSRSVYRGPGMRKSIALTFDDDPSESTPILLDYLEKHGVTATFFECGMNARRLPSVAREVVAAGHQLGNHTWSHPHLLFRSPAAINREFADTQHLLIAETGAEPVVLRSPYGLRSIGLRAVQNKLDLLEIQWTVIGNDWKLPDCRHYRPGAARSVTGRDRLPARRTRRSGKAERVSDAGGGTRNRARLAR